MSLAGTPLTTRTFLIGTLAARNSSGPSTTTGIPSAPTTSAPVRSAHPPGSMIALYVITGSMCIMFVIVILVGARRAIRHPERYGRRQGDETQGPQSTAGGIAQAILDTFPVIQFNRSVSTLEQGWSGTTPKRVSSERESRSIVLPELNAAVNPRQSMKMRSLSEEDEAHSKASEEYDESVELHAMLSGSCRTSGNCPAHHSNVEEAEAMVDQCPICLLDFEEGDDLRVLPCEKEHVYHKACIDPWLLEFSGSCPLCRKGGSFPLFVMARFIDTWDRLLESRS